jgi:4-oxalocrotonate tautomerase family enzyme
VILLGRRDRHRIARNPPEEDVMPVIDVKLYDRRVTPESVPKMIEALTNALHETSGAAREHIHVIIQGIPPQNWGQGGKPGA